jgi:hypothetical protein
MLNMDTDFTRGQHWPATCLVFSHCSQIKKNFFYYLLPVCFYKRIFLQEFLAKSFKGLKFEYQILARFHWPEY